jgi:mannose-6-phosphate isomerase-like protein (cupin superfamily)/uncharacterized RmlC-like cupin family protein
MMKKALAALGLCALLSVFASAQTTGDRIDLYFGDWHGASAHTTHGSLEERDIFTKGDGMNPVKKAAVLRYLDSYTYATLAPSKSTTATHLTGAQEIYFVVSGSGSVTAAGQTAELARNIAILMPANLEFTLKNTGSEPLVMYVIKEPTPSGFRPNSAMLVKDVNKLPITSTDGHWDHIVKTIFVTADGLATLESVLTVAMDPLTIGQPHNGNHKEIEEVWQALSGDSLAFVGNRLIRQTPGMAFLHIPDGKTPHTNVNYSEDTQATFLYFARYDEHENRK